jgi:hypothetical protein
MALMRVRITSFLAGFGIASGLALYQIRQDVVTSHAEVTASVRHALRACLMHVVRLPTPRQHLA